MPKLPEKIEDWQAPWEKKGEDFNAETAKKFIFDLHKDAEKLNESLKTVRSEKTVVETERDDLKVQLDAKTDGDNADLTALQRENASLKGKIAAAEKAENDRKTLALEVAMDIEDITVKQARALAPRLSGNTREELEEDAERAISDLGFHVGPDKPAEKPDGDDPDDDRDDSGRDTGLRRRNLRSPLDPDPSGGTPLPEPTLEKVNELFPM